MRLRFFICICGLLLDSASMKLSGEQKDYADGAFCCAGYPSVDLEATGGVMEHRRSPGRIKLNLEDLQVESFEPLPAQQAQEGTIKGYGTEFTCAGPDCTTPGWCATFDTCPAECASVILTC